MMAAFLIAIHMALPARILAAQDEQFDDYEVRVIRPRFFTKKSRFELGAQTSVIMNQTFIYTYLATGLMTYHFSETLGLELAGSYGFSMDKDDKRTLKQTYVISTEVPRTTYILGGSLLWTPMYGKWQTSSGRLYYFDTFVSGGAGMTGVNYNYEWCLDTSNQATTAGSSGTPPPKTVGYPTFSMGVGQRIFINHNIGLRFDVRDYLYARNTADGSCFTGTAGESELDHNVMLQMGATKFF